VTERALFKLVEGGIQLLEIAPGVELKKDILDQMAFKPIINVDALPKMDSAIFKEETMGLASR
jgi:propionate CoA-transferase